MKESRLLESLFRLSHFERLSIILDRFLPFITRREREPSFRSIYRFFFCFRIYLEAASFFIIIIIINFCSIENRIERQCRNEINNKGGKKHASSFFFFTHYIYCFSALNYPIIKYPERLTLRRNSKLKR